MDKKDIPNIITGIRIIASPLIAPIMWSGHVLVGTISFVLIALTDMLDGYLARKWHAESVEGKYLDMIADKEFAGIMLISLIPSAPILLTCLGLETLIGIVNIKSSQRQHRTKSNMAGKIKTAALSILMGTVLVTPYASEIVNMVLPSISNINASAILSSITPFIATITIGLQLTSLYHYKEHYKKEEHRLKKEKMVEPVVSEEELTSCMEKSNLSIHFINNNTIRKLYRNHLYKDHMSNSISADEKELVKPSEKEKVLLKSKKK